MTNIQDIIVESNVSIRHALEIIDKGSKQIVLVVDNNSKLIGTVNDGDIRRGILKGITLDETIESIYYRTPTVANISEAKENIIRLATSKRIHQIPLVDNDGKLVGLDILDELIENKQKDNKVILMAGGLGTRLRPLTENIPKPMLKVGGKPILQTIVEKFASYGFVNIIMCVNYKSEIIKEYFGDGSKFGVNIEYIFEDKRMGTAGALSLINEIPKEPFFVMNGDLLTNVNFEHLLKFHLQNDSVATMCVREYDFQVPYGVVNVYDGKINSIEEKPVHKFFVNAGMYMLNPTVLNEIPNDIFYDMTSLFDKFIKSGNNPLSFPIHEYWIDIGKEEEYEKANREFFSVF